MARRGDPGAGGRRRPAVAPRAGQGYRRSGRCALRPTAPALLLLAACADNAPPAGGHRADRACDGRGDAPILVARSLRFARATDGISQGFDLDGAGPEGGCGVADYTDPEGTPGIDNALAALLPVLDTTEAAALEPLIQDAINGGSLLLMFGLSDLDDPADDACVDLEVFKGAGAPMVGYDGWLLPYQTFDLDPDTPVTAAPTAAMVGGRLDAGPIDEVWLALQVLDLDTTFALSDARVRLEPRPDGTWTGMIAGGVAVADIVDVVTLQNVDDAVFELLGPLLDLVADLDPDPSGTCTRLSATLTFDAVPAFLYDDP